MSIIKWYKNKKPNQTGRYIENPELLVNIWIEHLQWIHGSDDEYLITIETADGKLIKQFEAVYGLPPKFVIEDPTCHDIFRTSGQVLNIQFFRDEFNEKYSTWLEDGHCGLDIANETVINYLDEVFKDLIKIPNFKFSQIKLKFGKCCFYSTLSRELSSAIENKINEIIKEK